MHAKKPLPPTKLQNPGTVTTLNFNNNHHHMIETLGSSPGNDMLPTSGTTIRVPTKSQRSPACAVSTASALRITSTL